MKPSTHLDPESWRHNDTNLRRAVQQWNGTLPSLPEGFAERMQQRMKDAGAATAGDAAAEVPAKPETAKAPAEGVKHRRVSWPWWSAAAVAAAVVALILWPQANDTEQEVAQTIAASETAERSRTIVSDESGSNETAEQSRTIAASEAAGRSKAVVSSETAERSKAVALTGRVSSSNEERPAETVSVDNRPERAKAVAQQQPANDTAALPVTFPMERPVLQRQQPSTPATRNLLAVAVHVAPTGSEGGSKGEAAAVYMGDPPPAGNSRSDNYYFLAANGHTYASGYAYTKGLIYNADGDLLYADKLSVNAQEINDKRHSLPFTVATLVRFPLTGALSLETGLSYTRLSSTLDVGNTALHHRTRQRIDYIGLPLMLQLPLLQKTAWQLYGSAGLSVEVPVKATADVTLLTPMGPIHEQHEHPSAPVQLAPAVALGLQVNLTRHIGLFVQPSMQWFPDFGSDVETYRTAHPISFSLPLGLRWTI